MRGEVKGEGGLLADHSGSCWSRDIWAHFQSGENNKKKRNQGVWTHMKDFLSCSQSGPALLLCVGLSYDLLAKCRRAKLNP